MKKLALVLAILLITGPVWAEWIQGTAVSHRVSVPNTDGKYPSGSTTAYVTVTGYEKIMLESNVVAQSVEGKSALGPITWKVVMLGYDGSTYATISSVTVSSGKTINFFDTNGLDRLYFALAVRATPSNVSLTVTPLDYKQEPLFIDDHWIENDNRY